MNQFEFGNSLHRILSKPEINDTIDCRGGVDLVPSDADEGQNLCQVLRSQQCGIKVQINVVIGLNWP